MKRASDLLTSAAALVSAVLDEEEDSLYNIPESFQGGERYEKSETAVDLLTDAGSSISDAIEKIDEAVS